MNFGGKMLPTKDSFFTASQANLPAGKTRPPTGKLRSNVVTSVLLLMLGVPTLAQAAERRWDGDWPGNSNPLNFSLPCSGQFTDNNCWTAFDSPDSNDSAIYTNSENVNKREVLFNGGTFTNLSATVSGSGYSWKLGGGDYILTNALTLTSGSGLAISGGGKLKASTAAINGAFSAGSNTSFFDSGSLTVNGGSISTGTTGSTSGGQIDVGNILTLSGGAIATGYYGLVDDFNDNSSNLIEAHSAVITGTGTTWNTNSFFAGEDGAGTASVRSGGLLKSTADTFIGVRNGSNGTLNVNAGGTVDTNGSGYIGRDTGSTGTVTVGGAGALWDVANGLYVGGSASSSGGTGTLTVSSGGKVKTGSLKVWNGNSRISTGSTSSLSGGVIDIAGALTLQGGGDATSYYGIVDSAYSSSINNVIYARGGATVSGSGSRWDTRNLYAGYDGTGILTVSGGGLLTSVATFVGLRNGSNGTLNVNAGGTLDTNDEGYLGYFFGSTGRATVGGTNALWDVANGLYVGGNDGGSGGTGILTVNTGGKVNAASLTVWNGNSRISTGNLFSSSVGGVIDIAGALTLQGGGDATSYFGIVDSTYSLNVNNVIYARSSAIVSGSGSRWGTAQLYAGLDGTGTLTVSGGGTVASVSSTFIGVNNGSSGTLNVNAGGTVDTNNNGYLGHNLDSTGTATVSGNNALWDVANGLYVGGDSSGSGGTGTLTVNSGGKVKAASLTVWNGSSSINTGGLNSPSGGIIDIAGALTLQGGGDATSSLGIVDSTYSSNFTNVIYARGGATVSGSGSRWDTRELDVGIDGTGTLTVSNGGTVTSASITYIGFDDGSSGTLNVNAGGTVDTNNNAYLGHNLDSTGTVTVGGVFADARWNIANGLYVGGRINGSGGTGTLTVNSGGKVTARSLKVWNGNSSINTGRTGQSSGGVIDIAGALTLQGGGDATSRSGVVDSTYSSITNNVIYARGGATVSGSGSRWDTVNFSAGYGGTGTLTVSDGGTVASLSSTFIGINNGSNGTLNVNAGGTVDTRNKGYLGFNTGANGVATVGGTGALWNVANGLYVGGNDGSSGGTGTLTVNGGGKVKAGSLTVWNGNSSISTGSTGQSLGGVIDIAGALTLQGGGDATSFYGIVDSTHSAIVSNVIYARGSATVSGSGASGIGSRWDTRQLSVGIDDTGTSTLTVSGGGTVASLSSTFIGVNNGSNGTLNVNAGGTVDTNNNGYLGFFTGATGTATVGGTNALWDVANGLYVGENGGGSGGTGILTVNSGGKVNVGTSLVIGDAGTVNVNGGELNTNNISSSGNGLLNIQQGVVSATGSAALFDLQGRTTVGVASALIADGGTVNLAGTVSNGGALVAKNNGTINLSSTGVTNNSVTVATSGGTVSIANGTTLIGGLVEANGAGSVVDVQAGGKIESHAFVDVIVQAKDGGRLNVDGTVNGSVSIFDGGILTGSGNIMDAVTNSNGGQFNAGNSPGSMTIGGDYTQDAFSTFTFELAGTEQGTEYDWVDVGGTASLAGELEILWFDLGSGLFSASLGDSFDLLTAETLTGEFDLLTLAVLGNGLDWDLSYLTDEIGTTDVLRLSVVSAVPVPAAVWLFASGLIGLIGVGRRKAA